MQNSITIMHQAKGVQEIQNALYNVTYIIRKGVVFMHIQPSFATFSTCNPWNYLGDIDMKYVLRIQFQLTKGNMPYVFGELSTLHDKYLDV